MVNLKQRKTREFESFKTVSDVVEILKGQFKTRKLYIKYSTDKADISINEYLDDDTLMLIADPSFEPKEEVTIYGLSDKYFEIEIEVIETKGPGYFHGRIKTARRATAGRRDLRFKVNSDDVVATNFRVSKHSIDLSGFKMPTSIKVVLDQFQSSNSKMSDIIKVDIFDSGSTDAMMNNIKKSGKCLYIADVQNPESYKPMTDDFIDAAALYGSELKGVINRNVEKGYKSIIIAPIIYIADNESSIPFGYIQLISKTENFDIEKVLLLKEHSFKLVDRIRDANTMMLPVHQEVIDVSRGGVKLMISDNNLKTYILKSKGFIFDIVFKLQAPITIYGEVKVTYADEMGNLFVGVDFEGNSSRKDEMKRFYAILKPLESDYKSKLLKTMKKK